VNSVLLRLVTGCQRGESQIHRSALRSYGADYEKVVWTPSDHILDGLLCGKLVIVNRGPLLEQGFVAVLREEQHFPSRWGNVMMPTER
jgi:hypothetical protein